MLLFFLSFSVRVIFYYNVFVFVCTTTCRQNKDQLSACLVCYQQTNSEHCTIWMTTLVHNCNSCSGIAAKGQHKARPFNQTNNCTIANAMHTQPKPIIKVQQMTKHNNDRLALSLCVCFWAVTPTEAKKRLFNDNSERRQEDETNLNLSEPLVEMPILFFSALFGFWAVTPHCFIGFVRSLSVFFF